MKTADVWRAADANHALDARVTVDAKGELLAVPDGTQVLVRPVDLDPASAGTSHVYVLTWDGGGSLAMNGLPILSQEPGRVVFRYDGDSEWWPLVASNLDPANLPRDIHLVREDQQALFAAGEVFNPAFLEKADLWGTLRFKDWTPTENSQLSSWSDRNTPDSVSWMGEGGVPIETQVALANRTHADMWINIPAHADDDYVRRTLAYVHDNLDAGLTVKVEYSNEMWNWVYEQSHYALDMADKLWGRDANGDGVVNSSDPAEHVADGWMRFYGYRSAQVAAIARETFADAPARVDPVLATQTAYQGLEAGILAGVAQAGLGSVGSLFDSWAVTTYFGTELDPETDADRAQVLAWARGGEAGMAAAFKELASGGLLSGKGALPVLAANLAYQQHVASANGLEMVAYEGGAHLTTASFDPAVRGEVIAFFERLLADPRMGDLYTRMAEVFSTAGGTDLVALGDIGRSGTSGDWGILHSVYDTSSARFNALRLMAESGQLPATSTAAATFALDRLSATLTYTGAGSFTGTGNMFDNVITGGAHGNVLAGLGGNDLLTGGAGRDDLDGGTGADRMVGGAGDDIYHVDHRGDEVVEGPGGGTDLVQASLDSYTLPDEVENLVAVAVGVQPARFTGTGNALDNVMTGHDGGNALYGLAGNDRLVGGAGDDLLDGGTGRDTMAGGAGNDTYLVDMAGEVVTELPGGGTDEVRTTLAAYALGGTLENLTALGTDAFTGVGNGVGNVIRAGTGAARLFGLGGDDTLFGGAGADLLDGGTGADRMVGGAGDDIYLVDDAADVVEEQPGGGSDTVRVSISSYSLTPDVEKLIYTGTGYFTGGGNALNNNLSAGAGGSNLWGGDGNDLLTGGAGADRLNGEAGADRMVGGGGDDIYWVDQAGDVVVEAANGGTDLVVAGFGYRLAANVENLRLFGPDATSGTGNALNNEIYAGTAGATLAGMEGNDSLIGGAGADTLLGGNGNDQLNAAGVGDRLDGEAGDDLLVGAAGDDVMIGGAGQDAAYGGGGADRFTFRTGDFATAPAAKPDAPLGSWVDVIGDFSHAEGDLIDLSAVDTGTASQVFAFLGDAAFTGHAGELRAPVSGAGYDVMGDTNGDGVADFHLYVASWTTAPTALLPSDFIF